MTPENTLSLTAVVDPGVKKHFVDGYKQKPPQLDKIFKVDTQTSETDKYQNYTGIGSLNQVNQGGIYDEDVPIQAYGVNLSPVKYGKMIPVTYELMKWAKAKEIWDSSAALGRATARHIEKAGASVLNNSQNTSYISYSDNKPLGSTQHTRADGGSAQSNASSTGLVPSYENMEVGLLAMEYQLDDRGQAIALQGQRVIAPPQLRQKFITLLKTEKKPGTTDNDINVYNSMQEYYGVMELLIWYYLGAPAGGSNTRWFVEDKEESKLMWQWADKPNVKRDESIGFKNDTVYYKGMYYASKGWRDWRGIWVSAGDKAAFSS
jgi:phage major head subunit gpT-like protein